MITPAKSFFFAFAFVASACIAFAVAKSVIKQPNFVQAVMDERVEMARQCSAGKRLRKTDDGRFIGINQVSFYHRLTHIDVSKCPNDFRADWANYMFCKKQMIEGGGLGELIEFVGGVYKGPVGTVIAVSHSMSNGQKRTDKASEAWEHCYETAIRYGSK